MQKSNSPLPRSAQTDVYKYVRAPVMHLQFESLISAWQHTQSALYAVARQSSVRLSHARTRADQSKRLKL